MNAIDFSQTEEFVNLFKKMDAPLIDNWEVLSWNRLTDKELEIIRHIGKDIKMTDENLKLSNEGFFVYKGQKVVVYIRDQRYYPNYGEKDPKFHITDCSTLVKMKSKNRYDSRYVVTDRRDGKFIVNIINMFTGKKTEGLKKELKICKNCLMKLRYRGYPTNYEIYHTFDLSDYFEKNISSFQKLPGYNAETAPISDYAQNWKEISDGIKSQRKWRCESCDKNMQFHKKYLHVHHSDGNPANNSYSNLMVLCIRCHSKEFNHDHLKNSPDYKRFMMI